MRLNLVKLLQSNLLINGCQLSQRKQLGHILHKYFDGYSSGVSIKLFIEAVEYHYEGLDASARDVLKNGLTDLLSECGQKIHRDELFSHKPIDLTKGVGHLLKSTQESDRRPTEP